MSRWLVLMALLGGCNQAFGLDPATLGDGGAEDPDAIVTEDAARCTLTQTLGAGAPRAISYGTDTLEVDAVAAQGSSHYIVGAATSTLNVRRGLVLKRGGAAMSWLIAGGVNDQLWGIAPGAMNALAVGMSRSTGASPHDRGVVAMIDGATPKVWTLEDGVNDVQFSAVHSPGDKWFIAGRHLGGDRIVVARLGLDHAVETAKSLQFDPTQPHRVLELVVDNTRVFVAGQFGTPTAPGASFLTGLARGTLDPIWVRYPDFTVFDVSMDGADLVAVGFRGADGVIARLAPDTGALRSAQLLPGRPLHGVIAAGADRWIAGPTSGSGTFVGRLDGDCATITRHSTVLGATPVLRPPVVAAGGGIATLYGANLDKTKVLERLLDGNGASTCAATAESAAAVPTTVLLTTGGGTSMPVTLVKTAVASALVTVITPSDLASCD